MNTASFERGLNASAGTFADVSFGARLYSHARDAFEEVSLALFTILLRSFAISVFIVGSKLMAIS